MEWLSQNGIWFALFAGMMWLCGRGHRGASTGGCCAHRGTDEEPRVQPEMGRGEVARSTADEAASDKTPTRSATAQHGGHAGCH